MYNVWATLHFKVHILKSHKFLLSLGIEPTTLVLQAQHSTVWATWMLSSMVWWLDQMITCLYKYAVVNTKLFWKKQKNYFLFYESFENVTLSSWDN